MSSSIARVCSTWSGCSHASSTIRTRWRASTSIRAVDAGGGRMGEAGDPPFRKAKSVELSSRRLGLIAKADIIEQRDGKVVSVEVKRGRPPKHGPAWMPEKVQLCTIGLLLRDNGYQCSEGEIYFAETRKRVTIPFDDTLVAHTLRLVEELRAAAASPSAPPPLVDSPKVSEVLGRGHLPAGRDESPLWPQCLCPAAPDASRLGRAAPVCN